MKFVLYYIIASVGLFLCCINNAIITLAGAVIFGLGAYKLGKELGM